MADLLVGPIMAKLIESGFEYLKDQVRWQTGMKDELLRLRNIQPKIQAVVDYASSQPQIRDQNTALNEWLWQLRDAIDEADDVLDELEYMKLEQQLITNIEETKPANHKKLRKVRSIMKSVKKRLVKVVKRALRIDPNLKRLEEAVKKLDQVSADVHAFLHLLDGAKHELEKHQLDLYKTRETGSSPNNDLISRVEEKEYVIRWLRKPTNDHKTHFYKKISLLSIVGHGGMGKTTLLQHVYADEMTKEFELKIWVCVSNNFDVKIVIADMLESLKKERPHLKTLDTLKESLRSEVMSKKFLLVLDNIWEEEGDKIKWEDVLAPLASGKLGSKILVTTRTESAASMMASVINKKNELLPLKGLEESECLQLLNSHAFAGENPDDHKKLRHIAKNIVKKLSGSPLAAKVIGGVLNSSLDERHWLQVLNSDIGGAKLNQNDILSTLRLSYIFLPKHLQKNFAFCSIFQQDHLFNKKDLVRMWIALGFIQPPSNSEETMEDIGGSYFDILVKKSFFFKEFQIQDKTYYKMHDLLHELAQSVSAQECIRVVSNDELTSKIPKTIRHLCVETSNLEVLRKMEKIKKLRSLFLVCKDIEDEQGFVDELAEVFKASSSIRLLYIHFPGLKMIPEAIKHLIHLRYLKVYCGHNPFIGWLLRSLSNLYHLQFMVYGTKIVHSSDTFINNLSNLRYLPKMSWNEIPGPVGKLNSLQKLEFNVMDEVGYRIGGLEHMDELHKLKIKHLENVKDIMEASSAKLSHKKKLSKLSLEWSEIGDRRNIEKLLDNLQPYKNLKQLQIKAYMGVMSAIWMNNSNLMSNLEYIRLDECLEWQILPPFGQLPFLKSLYLHKMPKVKKLENKFYGSDEDCAFPSLEVLHIEKLKELEDWFDATAAVDDRLFPCLTKIYLKNCPNMRELPCFPPKLKILEIYNIGWQALNGKKGTSSCRNMSKPIPLETLKVHRCPNITYISLADEKARPAAGRYVEILRCPNLISLGGHQEVETAENCLFALDELRIDDPSVLLMEPLRSIASLEKLTIKDNGELVSFPAEAEQWFMQISSSLRELRFSNLISLKSLPSYLASLSSLELLSVEYIPQLQQLPNIPASLKLLTLSSLKSLQCLPSSLSTISSLEYLHLESIPLVKSLPDLPPLCELFGIKPEELGQPAFLSS